MLRATVPMTSEMNQRVSMRIALSMSTCVLSTAQPRIASGAGITPLAFSRTMAGAIISLGPNAGVAGAAGNW